MQSLDFAHRSQPTIIGDHYPTTFIVDGRALRFLIKRFDLAEYNAFLRDFNRCGRIAKRDELLLDKYRKPVIDRETGLAKKHWIDEPVIENGKPVIVDGLPKMQPVERTIFEDDATVLARIELEETAAERAVREQRDADDEKFSTDFLTHAITTYVSLEARQLSTESEPITTGAQILRYFAARQDVLQGLLQRIYTENVPNDSQKKMLESRRASERISTPSTPTADGGAPAPTAESASNSISAPVEAATASTEG